MLSHSIQSPACLTTVSKLLINAWSAEYALCLEVPFLDPDYIASSLNWFLPQAYYSFLFSLRARLVVDDVHVANARTVEDEAIRLARTGAYGPVVAREESPFADLFAQRIQSGSVYSLPVQAIAPKRAKLIRQVQSVALIHETYIHNRLGSAAYQQLVGQVPAYLINNFVGARFNAISVHNL